jgi:bacillopeptidase F
MKKILLTVTLSLLLVFGVGISAYAGVLSPDLEATLESAGPDEEVAVIVSLADKVDLKAFKDEKDKGVRRGKLIKALQSLADISQKELKQFLKNKKAKKVQSLWIFNGLAVTANREVILDLADQPGVESIRLDATLRKPEPAPAAAAAPAWNLDMIRARELWAMGYTGAGVVVAAMDTGVDANHQDLASRYRGGSNSWYDPNGEHAGPYDADGHGTQSMGLIVGGDSGGSPIGVAPDAQWIAVKIFDDSGSATASGIHQGFQWLLDPDGNSATDDAADVVNNSWRYGPIGGCDREFEPDIGVLRTAEIVVVFSGGNYGPTSGTSISPANNDGGFAVGAVDDTSALGNFSSRGPSACDASIYPEVVAPGVNVRTADLTFGGVFPDLYVNVSGTSFSAPHVAGAMALLLSAHSNSSVAELEQAVQATTMDLGPVGSDNDYGDGLIDVVEAESYLASPPGPVCWDNDSDGFFAEADCGTEVDCNDNDPAINPEACDIKGDGIDQDCDGQDRTKGKACPSSGGGGGGNGNGGGKGGGNGKGKKK